MLQWALTREAGVSYASHVGGAAAGLLLGVVILRRRPARSNSDFVRRLGRPAVLLALVLSIFLFAFGITWYAAVYPPKPLSRGWYDAYGFGVRPCCHQAWFCDVEPTDALTCEFRESDATWALSMRGRCSGAAVQLRRRSVLRTRRRMSRCSSGVICCNFLNASTCHISKGDSPGSLRVENSTCIAQR